jgi:cobyrinic acid a,c-diamide synthase
MRKRAIPRVLIGGTGSSSGKTTVVCALLQAFRNRNLFVGAFKCGPDYIDPMFHKKIIGAASSNLDAFFFDENTCRRLLAENGEGRDVNLIEGVMGFYDGVGASGKASTYELARHTQSPVVLVVDAKGASTSLLAALSGFLSFLPENNIRGVILNRCGAATYAMLKQEAEKRFPGIRMLGFLPHLPACALESRHLGLVTAREVSGLQEKMRLLAEAAEQWIDLDGILQLASQAPDVAYEMLPLPRFSQSVRIAVARDEAFCFYYEDSLSVLKALGAELVSFSPLNAAALPQGVAGLYLGGGYPELYAERLSGNRSMREQVKRAIAAGLPCIAECGGFQYLTEALAGCPMVGALPGNSFETKKLVRFGYVTLTARKDNMLCRAGEQIPAHEFHYWDSERTGDGFTARKPSGKSWDCVFATDTLYAGYPHFHFAANPEFAVNFYKACLKEKYEHDAVCETGGD